MEHKGKWTYKLVEDKDFNGKKCLMLKSVFVDKDTEEDKTSVNVDWDDVLGDNVVTEMEYEFILDDLYNQLMCGGLKK